MLLNRNTTPFSFATNEALKAKEAKSSTVAPSLNKAPAKTPATPLPQSATLQASGANQQAALNKASLLASTASVTPSATSPEEEALIKMIKEESIRQNTIPDLRNTLWKQGYDGKGMNVLVIDDFDASDDSVEMDNFTHGLFVKNVINGPQDGVSAANVLSYNFEALSANKTTPSSLLKRLPANPNATIKKNFQTQTNQLVKGLRSLATTQKTTGAPGQPPASFDFKAILKESLIGSVKDTETILTKAVKDNPSATVLNNSWGSASTTFTAFGLAQSYGKDANLGIPPLTKAEAESLWGKEADKLNLQQRYEKLLTFFDSVEQSAEYKQAEKSYIAATKNISETMKKPIVFAAGNTGGFKAFITESMGQAGFKNVRIPSNAELGSEAISPYIINVGASRETETGSPKIKGDETIASFSSAGDGGINGVNEISLVAPGQFMRVSNPTQIDKNLTPNSPTAQAQSVQGTSFSAPYVSGIISLMVQAAGRPLSGNEVKQLLQKSAKDLGSKENRELVGSGFIDPEAAVKAAASLNCKR